MNVLAHANDISGKFLIAAPGLEDTNFRQTVVLICEHTEEGAFGLVVNRILMNSFMPILKNLEIERALVDMPVHYGGPVKPDQGYVIYSPYDDKYGAIRVGEGLAVTASKEIICDIAAGRGPERYLMALGFAGWGPNQLDEELMMDAWLVAPLDRELVFSLPVGDRWKCAANSIGVDFERFSYRSGSA